MTSPPADLDVTEPLVRALLIQQHPDLAHLPLRLLDSGWDNTSWRLGPDLMVRLPRRTAAASLILHEQQWLPELAPRLPLPVPGPIRVGHPSGGYPWAWSIVPWIAGEPGDRARLTDPGDTAERLGQFLRALHQPAPADAPHNPARSGPLIERAPYALERLSQVAGQVDASGIRRAWALAVEAEPWAGPPTWLHGDLHPANVVIANGTLAGVIDFGDLCAGDPATDLASAWLLLPASARPRFEAAYGGLDPGLERRAIGWAIHLALILLLIGLDDKPTYATIGRAALTRVLT